MYYGVQPLTVDKMEEARPFMDIARQALVQSEPPR